MNPVVAGFLLALTMAAGVGPGLMFYFQAAVRRGFWAGLAVLLGLWISDATIVVLSSLGVSQVLTTSRNRWIAAVIGAAVLIIIGIVQLSTAAKPAALDDKARKNHASGFLAGLLLNSSNPFIYGFWITLIGVIGSQYGMKSPSFCSFFVSLFLGCWTFDTIKCFAFSRCRIRLNLVALGWINRITGGFMVTAGVLILGRTFLAVGFR